MSLFYRTEKLRARINELENYRFHTIYTIPEWKLLEDETKQEKYPPSPFSNSVSFVLGDRWKGRDYYLWIQQEIIIPDEENLYLYLDFGHTGGGYNSGFESLLFINREIYQGVDSNHKEVKLAESYRNQTITVSLKLWSGLEGGGEEKIQTHEFRRAAVCRLNRSVDGLICYADMLHKTMAELGETNPLYHRYSILLNQTFQFLDWSEPGSETFHQSVEAAYRYLKTELQSMSKDSPITVTTIGHTHIDVAWLWRLKHTREKAARSFATVLRLMEEYPDYIFLQTQPQLYQFIKEDYPELFDKIKERVAEGRWEVDGAMWLEADCNIPSGESLTRQILHGSQFIRNEFQKEVHYLWLPDVFGYSWALPQILKKSGIDTFMTTKISWNQFNRMPHDTFIWKGLDGSEVLTHFITTPEPGEENEWESNWYYTYNGELEPETVLGVYEAYRDKNINQNLLISYGFGDGGGGVTRDMLEKRRVMDQLPGLPYVKTGRADDYFATLQETFKQTSQYIHTWDGELYLEYHRGTYTSQAFVKKMNRQCELFLRRLEYLFSLLDMKGYANYPQKELYTLWETVLRNQFHDIIPGSSIREVYQDYRLEMGQVVERCHRLLSGVRMSSSAMTVCNTSTWERTSILELPLAPLGYNYIDSAGKPLLSFNAEDKTYALIEALPAYASEIVQLSETPETGEPIRAAATVALSSIENEWYQIQWNEEGHLTQIYDKEHQKEVLAGKGNVFQLFEDKPMNFDAWDIDIFYQEKHRVLVAESVEALPTNPLYDSVRFCYRFGKSTLVQEMRLYHHTKRIDFVTEVDWQERQQLLKVKFDVNVRSTYATYDIQYGNVRRATNWNTSWELAKFESVVHQWVDLSQRDYGVSLLNDSKYGCDVKGQTLRLSLLKGAIFPDPIADIGSHQFTYSLYPHRGDFIEGETVKEAWEINDPLGVVEAAVEMPQMTMTSGAHVFMDTLKKAEDGNGYIFRFHEYAGGTDYLELLFENSQWWQEVDLLERPIGAKHQGTIVLTMQPYEIRTVRIGMSQENKDDTSQHQSIFNE
ncbi:MULTISPECIES: alpha-mannosidase [unclassified Streptococcus]|uniref:alpha-mannosidase n=1 Tax=unclassified Streptococcus TaxID=2608887 RepID=UPI0010717AD4|nr:MULTISPECIES: alpha-mannosidase [unclassified Streptococcus]MBF0787401.1 alpha-mannosidase [Streptococcus sp. 19428wC2_LYSM12]MCQ9211774.1 alpha-mannosidase [Streptococcus sp. B01]MCQ9213037.1 alpha-mannosidase [Streptococcus sp. O1]TFV05622.1 alpha-mannosidase [Streptococcus sp. LYSM12]